VAVVTTVHVPGDTRIWHKQVGSLARNGYQVHYVAPDLAEFSTANQVVLHDLGPRVQTPASRIGRIRRAVGVVRRLRPDIIHFHDPELLPAMTAASRGLDSALVYDIHENVRQQLRIKPWLPGRLRPVAAAVYGVMESLCLRAVDSLVLAEDSYSQEYVGRERVIVKNYPIADRVADAARSLPAAPTICYVGGVSVERGALDLMKAFRILAGRMNGLSLVLAGPIMAPLTKEILLEELSGTGLEERVRIPGRVPLDEAYSLMAQAAVGVAPLRAVGNYVGSLPTKMFEYMSCALPVVVSGFPMWSDIVDEAGCGCCFTPGDPEDLAVRIGTVLGDEASYRVMSENALAAIGDRYNWNHEAAKLLDLYRRITR